MAMINDTDNLNWNWNKSAAVLVLPINIIAPKQLDEVWAK